MGYDGTAESRRCYERLSREFQEVRALIDLGDLDGACYKWGFALLDSHHAEHMQNIRDLVFQGAAFNSYAEVLLTKLHEKNRDQIDFCIGGLQGAIGQEKIRREALAIRRKLDRGN